LSLLLHPLTPSTRQDSCRPAAKVVDAGHDFESFWRNVIDEASLQQAMVLLDRDLFVP
jgi:hypothetical protein